MSPLLVFFFVSSVSSVSLCVEILNFRAFFFGYIWFDFYIIFGYYNLWSRV